MKLSAAQTSIVSVLLGRGSVDAARMSKRGIKTLEALDYKQVATRNADHLWTLTEKGKTLAGLLDLAAVTACVHCFRAIGDLDDSGVCTFCAPKAAAKLDESGGFRVGDAARPLDAAAGGRFKIAFFTIRGGENFAHSRQPSIGPYKVSELTAIRTRDTSAAADWEGPILTRVTRCTRSGVVTGYFEDQAPADETVEEEAERETTPPVEITLRARCKVAFGSVTQYAASVRNNSHIDADDLRGFVKFSKNPPAAKIPYNAIASVGIEQIETDRQRAPRGEAAAKYQDAPRVWINGKEYAQTGSADGARFTVESVNRGTAYKLTRLGAGWFFRATETGRRYAVKTIGFGTDAAADADQVAANVADAAEAIETEQDGETWANEAHAATVAALIQAANAAGDYEAADAIEAAAEVMGFDLDTADAAPDLDDPAISEAWNRYESERSAYPEAPLTTIPLDTATGMPVSFAAWANEALPDPIAATPTLAFVAYCGRYGGSKTAIARALGIHVVQLHRYYKQSRIDAGAALEAKGAHAVKVPMLRLMQSFCRLADAGLSVEFPTPAKR